MFRLAREKAEKLQSQENEEKASIMSAQIEKSRKRREGEHYELGFLKLRSARGQLLIHGIAVSGM